MCLYTKNPEPKAAEERITCWKFVEVIKGFWGDKIHITPYAFKKLEPEVLEGKKPFKAVMPEGGRPEPKLCLGGEYTVAEGWVHSFIKLDMNVMESEFEYLARDVGRRDTHIIQSAAKLDCERGPKVVAMQIWKCSIPVGAEYILGNSDNRIGTYASDEIVFEEMVLEITEEDSAALIDDISSEAGKYERRQKMYTKMLHDMAVENGDPLF